MKRTVLFRSALGALALAGCGFTNLGTDRGTVRYWAWCRIRHNDGISNRTCIATGTTCFTDFIFSACTLRSSFRSGLAFAFAGNRGTRSGTHASGGGGGSWGRYRSLDGGRSVTDVNTLAYFGGTLASALAFAGGTFTRTLHARHIDAGALATLALQGAALEGAFGAFGEIGELRSNKTQGEMEKGRKSARIG